MNKFERKFGHTVKMKSVDPTDGLTDMSWCHENLPVDTGIIEFMQPTVFI